MQLFYNPNIEESTSRIQFSKEESKHIIKVLRKKEGDLLHITNGKGWLFDAEITIPDLKNCQAQIVSKVQHSKRDYHIHLAVAPTKMNDRFEWFLEKATEIGVDSITPILCDHSERKVIKPERFEKILQSAMKQSLQTYLPKLNPLIGFKDIIAQHFEGQRFIAHCEENDKTSLKSQLEKDTDCLILIGPEGDFSSNEIEMALQNDYKAVSLGDNRLRTETAAIVACHSIVFKND